MAGFHGVIEVNAQTLAVDPDLRGRQLGVGVDEGAADRSAMLGAVEVDRRCCPKLSVRASRNCRLKPSEPSMLRQTTGVTTLRAANTRPLPESNDLRPPGPKPAEAEMSPRRCEELPAPLLHPSHRDPVSPCSAPFRVISSPDGPLSGRVRGAAVVSTTPPDSWCCVR